MKKLLLSLILISSAAGAMDSITKQIKDLQAKREMLAAQMKSKKEKLDENLEMRKNEMQANVKSRKTDLKAQIKELDAQIKNLKKSSMGTTGKVNTKYRPQTYNPAM